MITTANPPINRAPTARSDARESNPLRAAYAKEELGRIEKLREIFLAYNRGQSQTSIALEAGISQAEVSRSVKRVKLVPSMIDRCPREVILEFVAGEISADQMLQELSQWNYSHAQDAEANSPLSVRTSGSWEQISDAYSRGLIDYDHYEYLQQRSRGAGHLSQ